MLLGSGVATCNRRSYDQPRRDGEENNEDEEVGGFVTHTHHHHSIIYTIVLEEDLPPIYIWWYVCFSLVGEIVVSDQLAGVCIYLYTDIMHGDQIR